MSEEVTIQTPTDHGESPVSPEGEVLTPASEAAAPEAPITQAAPEAAVTQTPSDLEIEAAPTDPTAYWNAYETEWAENGNLSDESYGKILQERGITKEHIGELMAGREARATLLMQEVGQITGGDEGLNRMKAWAQQNLPAEQLELFNAEIQSSSHDRIINAIANLHARYQGAHPSGNLVQGTPNANTGAGAFESVYQMLEAQKDPRYKAGDPAFHTEFNAKHKAAIQAGNY